MQRNFNSIQGRCSNFVILRYLDILSIRIFWIYWTDSARFFTNTYYLTLSYLGLGTCSLSFDNTRFKVHQQLLQLDAELKLFACKKARPTFSGIFTTIFCVVSFPIAFNPNFEQFFKLIEIVSSNYRNSVTNHHGGYWNFVYSLMCCMNLQKSFSRRAHFSGVEIE